MFGRRFESAQLHEKQPDRLLFSWSKYLLRGLCPLLSPAAPGLDVLTDTASAGRLMAPCQTNRTLAPITLFPTTPAAPGLDVLTDTASAGRLMAPCHTSRTIAPINLPPIHTPS